MGSSSQHDVLRPVWGVDIGRTGLKAVRLERGERGRVRLSNAVRVNANRRVSSSDAAPAGALLPPFVERHVRAEDALWIAVPAERGVHRTFPLQEEDTHDVEGAVRQEVSRSIPLEPQSLAIDYTVLAEETEPQVHVFAIRREDVDELGGGVERPFDGVQLADVALCNAMIADRNLAARAKRRRGRRAPSLAFLEMGVVHTTIVVTDGLDFWSRVVPVGGRHFTIAIADGLGCSPADAEMVKRGTKPVPPAEFVPLLKDVYFDFAARVNQSFGTFQASVENTGLARVVCVGDGFRSLGLVQFLQQQLQRDVDTFTEMQRIVPADREKHAGLRNHPGDFAIAYGLAVQGLGLTAIRTNLVGRTASAGGWGRRIRSWFGRG